MQRLQICKLNAIQVKEERKVLISSRIVKDTSLSLEKQTLTFNDLYKNLIQPVFRFREVHVFVGKGDLKWNFVQDGLQDELTYTILTDLTKSLTLSTSIPWACGVIWKLVIEQVLALITIVDQYTNFLKKANDHIHEIHYSGIPVRDPSVNLEVYTIDADSNDIIKEIYE
ncbi:6720_t:CDS:2, partial [Funneliformis caledonium]